MTTTTQATSSPWQALKATINAVSSIITKICTNSEQTVDKTFTVLNNTLTLGEDVTYAATLHTKIIVKDAERDTVLKDQELDILLQAIKESK